MAADGKEKKKNDEEWTEQVEPQQQQQAKRKQSFEPGIRTGKRQRKAADTFAPSLYYAEPKQQHRVRVVVGRGVKLTKIPEIRESIRSSTKDSLELRNAFKLMYRVPGKTPIPEMKQSLLDFSGYLPVFDGSEDRKTQDKMVEDAEAIVSQRAYKMKHLDVKKLCDFFHLDRSLKTTKEELIDSKTTISRDKEVDDDEDDEANSDEDDKEDGEDTNDEDNDEEYAFDDSEIIANGEQREVSDKALRRWVKAYIACFNMDKATIRHAIQTASDKFGVNLASKKEVLKQLLTEEL
ncbi:hypothetical protein MHU86_2259 [Fragilaria crotonensis]|nr:hypothetical protein MHU86_2259 [Fragilaria crotonensis]